jgi:hypothetical protein
VAVSALAGRGGRRRIDPVSYELIHRELLQMCRERATASDDPARQYYEEMEGLAGPWLTTRALEQAGLEILLDLAERCQRIDRELGGARWRPRLAGLDSIPVRAALAILAVGGLLVAWRTTGARDWADDLVAVLRFGLRRSTQTQQLLAGGFGVALIGWLLLSYTRRS